MAKRKSIMAKLIDAIRSHKVREGGGNPNRVPAGSSKGGQFTSGRSGKQQGGFSVPHPENAFNPDGVGGITNDKFKSLVNAGEIFSRQINSRDGYSDAGVSVKRFVGHTPSMRILSSMGLVNWENVADLNQFMRVTYDQHLWTKEHWAKTIYSRINVSRSPGLAKTWQAALKAPTVEQRFKQWNKDAERHGLKKVTFDEFKKDAEWGFT